MTDAPTTTEATSARPAVPRAVRPALAALASAQKPSTGAPAYSRFVNRRLGRWAAAVAYTVGATPNQVTALSAACTFAGIAVLAFAPSGIGTALAVVLLLVVGYALDSADGQVARLRGGGSPAGEWLDHVIDATKIAVLHLAVFASWLREPEGREALLAAPLVYQVVATVAFFAIVLTDQLRRAEAARTGVAAPVGRRTGLLYSLAVVPTDYGLMCLAFVLLAWPPAFTVVYLALLVANAGYLVLALPKWFRELRSLTPPSIGSRS
ncbi:CDP-alcohol phosphatidyltransferase family protein [Frigoribacterium sp. ME-P-080]|uniref:CDP-alcohol phosphatidyltransferase family protein n=1 Tax=Frigoribacterium sp. ME-P-080 TaxID=3040289 RepID=UPI0025508F4A|nr:CDP-alcohol phosphatidyltransferase family protein [Frigoribacterium sp. ME-P-080]